MNVQEMAEALSNMRMVDLIELTKELRERWGITEKVHPMMIPANDYVKTVEQAPDVMVDVMLVSVPSSQKIACIKVIREITNCGLADGKKMAETPNSVIMKGLEPARAKEIVAKFQAVGVVPELVPAS